MVGHSVVGQSPLRVWSVITGSAVSSAANRRRAGAPLVISVRARSRSPAAHDATVSGSGYDAVTSQRRSVTMATVDHPLRPAALQHEPTYMDMETPKGLRNSRGENNCFLNSAVQVR